MDHLGKRVKRDKATKRVVFWTALSAYTKNPINLFIRGESSIGKTYNVVETLRYFPEENDILMLGGLSPTAIVHDFGTLVDTKGDEINFNDKPTKEKVRDEIRYNLGKGEKMPDKNVVYREYMAAKEVWKERLKGSKYIVDLSHKILVFLEAPHRRTYNMLRPILSHDKHEISYKFTNKTSEGQLRTSHVVVRGWPATIFLSSEEEYIKDLATRSFTITPETEPQKFRDAIRLTGEKKALPWKFDEDREFMLLAGYVQSFKGSAANLDVCIPFARELGEFYPATLARSMRDYDHLTTLIEVCALFHYCQRPVLEIGERKVVLADIQDLQDVLTIFDYMEETTVTGLPKYILDCFHKVIQPLWEERGTFHYTDLAERYNETFAEKKSTSRLRKYVELLSVVGWVDTEPDPSEKRKKLIRVIKNGENTIYSALNGFPEAFTLNSFKTWLDDAKKTCARKSVFLRDNFFDNSNNPSNVEAIYTAHYIGKTAKKPLHKNEIHAHIKNEPSETKKGLKSEKKPKKTISAQSLIIPEELANTQGIIEYAFEMMEKRLPDNSTGDNIIHDFTAKGLDQEEAKKLLNKLLDEGLLAQDPEGWIVKVI